MKKPELKLVETVQKEQTQHEKLNLLDSPACTQLVLQEIARWCNPEDGFPEEYRHVYEALTDLSNNLIHDDVFDAVESNFGGIFKHINSEPIDD